MAYVEVWKEGKLITRRPVSEERAQKGCRVRLGSAGQIRVKTGETKTVGKFEVRMFAGDIPVAGQEPTLSTFTGTEESDVTEETSYFPEVEGYKVTGRLGEGGMGTVWRAVQLSTHRDVALKLLSERRFESRKSRLRFEREVELTARLAHPNIARLYDSGLYRGVYYYAMELVDGVSLDEYVQQNQLSRMEILKLIYQVSEAVGYAHEQGIIHRDLKPSNILVGKDGQPHVLDFGLAKSTAIESEDVTVSIEGEIAGTPAYMAPEQASGNIHAVSTRTDVYSLGVLLYYLLTNQLPYDIEGSRYEVLSRIIQDEIPSPRKIDPSIDRELETILMTALAKEPNERYPSAVVFQMDIDNYLKDEPILAKMTGTTYYLVKKIKKHRIPVSAGVLVFLVILSIILIAYTKIIQSNTRIRTIRGELEIQKQAAEMAKSEADSFKVRWDDLEATVLSGRKEKDIRTAMLALKEEYLRTQKILEGTPEEKTAIQVVAENYLNVFGRYKEESFKTLKPVFSESCISFDSDGRAFKGPQESIAHLTQAVKSTAEKFDFDKTINETATIQVSGNNAFMIGQLISQGQTRGKNELVVAKQWYMLVFQKIRNKWHIASEYCAPPEITFTKQGSQHVLYVDEKAQGDDNGSSWSNAYRHLQDALAAASDGDAIWVAAGTYRPNEGGNNTQNDRTTTFKLKQGVAIYGGFPPYGGKWEDRDTKTHECILSGDLKENDAEITNLEDLRDHLSRADNSYHVVTGNDTNASAILDGFVITGGNANNNKEWPKNRGGGIIILKGSPTINNCTFRENSALCSGGVLSRYGSPVFKNCLFIRNAALGYEGVVDSGNNAAMGVVEGTLLVVNCRFIGNLASNQGGAIFVWIRGNLLLVNCIFSGNRAGQRGGAILNGSDTSKTMVYNCTFSNNFSPQGATIFNYSNSVALDNCILWDDSTKSTTPTAGNQINSVVPNGVVMNFCCVKDIRYRNDKRAVVSIDPDFLDSDGPDGEIGTLDDNVRLNPGSFCIDAGGDVLLPLDIADLDQDGDTTEQIPLDLDGMPRVVDEWVDMGAYEYQGQPKQQSQESRLNALSWNNAGPDAVTLYQEFLKQNVEYFGSWFILGIKLVGSSYWEQAFDSFQRCEQLHPDKNGNYYFAALVWEGHIYDLRGQREQALGEYQAALTVRNYGSMRHDQWGIVLNSKWVEDRLKEPFTKKMIGK